MDYNSVISRKHVHGMVKNTNHGKPRVISLEVSLNYRTTSGPANELKAIYSLGGSARSRMFKL